MGISSPHTFANRQDQLKFPSPENQCIIHELSYENAHYRIRKISSVNIQCQPRMKTLNFYLYLVTTLITGQSMYVRGKK